MQIRVGLELAEFKDLQSKEAPNCKFPKAVRRGCKRSFGPREQESSTLQNPSCTGASPFRTVAKRFGSLGPRDLLHTSSPQNLWIAMKDGALKFLFPLNLLSVDHLEFRFDLSRHTAPLNTNTYIENFPGELMFGSLHDFHAIH